MKDNCLDIGTIQAFLDCELSHDEVSRVSSHMAICEACTSLLGEAEEESVRLVVAGCSNAGD